MFCNTLVNVLVHLLEHLSFSIQMPQLFIIKIRFTIKVNLICGVGPDTSNLCHKFNSQDPPRTILGLSVASPEYQGPSSRVMGARVPCPRVPVPRFWVSVPRVPGSQSSRVQSVGFQSYRSWVSGSQGPGSQVPILDYALLSAFIFF